MAAQDCWMNSKDLMALLKVPSQKMMEHNMSERDLFTVYFRELAMRVQKLPYDQRTDFISSQLGLNEQLIINYALGHQSG